MRHRQILRRRLRLAIVVAVCAWPAAQPSGQIRATLVASGFDRPVAMVAYPDRGATFLVVEQAGRIRVVEAGVMAGTPFLDLRAEVASAGEQGLLGLALAPDFASSGRFFVCFTNRAGDSVVARFRRSATNPLVADASSRFDLRWPGGARVIHQPFTNHNGGHLAFGPDRYLYVGLGDGGSGNDPMHFAQNPQSLLGKMLRLDIDVPATHADGYTIPPTNPFVGRAGVLPEIWSFGLRNPWRWSFDDPRLGGTGALVIGDVGQNQREEIDYEPRAAGGRNYGWRNREGLVANVATRPPFFTPLQDPIYDYGRDVGRAVTGGYVYRGRALGAGWPGRYFFADSVSNRVWSMALVVEAATGEARAGAIVDHSAELGAASAAPVSFAVDTEGELYVVGYGGTIYRIDGLGAPPAPMPAPRPQRPHQGPPIGTARPRP